MAIGPVQLVVLGFDHPDFHGEIIAELERLRESDTIRVIDSIAVYKDAEATSSRAPQQPHQDEAIELGSTIGALIGLGIEGEEGLEAGAAAGAQAAAERASIRCRVMTSLGRARRHPERLGRCLILLEHQWAVPLRDAVMRAGGFRHQRRLHQSSRSGRDRA